MAVWHEDDEFWAAVEPALFSPERLAAAPSDVEEMAKLLGLHPQDRILDVCTGPGRHAIELAKRGCRVTGIDRTRRYLDRAESAAAAAGVALELVEADMLHFRREGAFDAAINLYTSFGYFDDEAENRRVAENILASLKPGGQALFEMMGKEVLARDFQKRGWVEVGDVLLVEDREIVDDWSRVRARWLVITLGGRLQFEVTLRLYSGMELKALLLDAGFETVALFGTLAGLPYDQKAQRLVAVAMRSA